MPWVEITFSGRVQMQLNLAFGRRRRRRETIASSVASFPEFMLPKWPKKLMLTGLCFVMCGVGIAERTNRNVTPYDPAPTNMKQGAVTSGLLASILIINWNIPDRI